MKKATAFLLCALLAFACACPAFAADKPSDFVPVLRFVASSDTHVREDSDVTTERIGKMLDTAYALSDRDRHYKNLDAVLVAGDLTNSGKKGEYDRFDRTFHSALRDGTKLLAVVARNHDGYTQSRKTIRDRCSEITGVGADFDVVIGGCHFIGVSVSGIFPLHYDAGQLRRLKQQLDAAVREDPTKPIFVMHHEHSLNTVYGSTLYDGWGVPYFNDLLRKYPQVVELSGHSHYPLNDPRSVWQGAYTAIGTGAIKSSEFTIGAKRAYHPDDDAQTSTFWIIDVNAQHDLRLRGLDVLEGRILCDFVIPNPADPDNRDFTPEKREAASEAPVFGKGATIDVTTTGNVVRAVVPAAQSSETDPAVLYRIAAQNALGTTIAKSWTLPSYYRAVTQDSIELELKNLPSGKYTICVTAENAYGKTSQPLSATVRVGDENAWQLICERILQWFADVKEYVVRWFR